MEYCNLPAVGLVFEAMMLFQGLLIDLSPIKPEILISRAPLVAEKLLFPVGHLLLSHPVYVYIYPYSLPSTFPTYKAVCRRHCVGGGAPVNFGRRRRRAAGPKNGSGGGARRPAPRPPPPPNTQPT